MIGIISYGSGNVNAIANIHHRLGLDFKVISSPDELDQADRLVLPGVGAFGETMKLLTSAGFAARLKTLVLETKKPILGICVGMQIFADRSEEGNAEGLGFVPGEVKAIDTSKIDEKPFSPHMGWNSVQVNRGASLFDNIKSETGFYFLHSYCYSCKNELDAAASSHYGEDFTCAIERDNIYGVQFHPEKSHSNGIQIFKNFSSITGQC